MKEGGWLEIIMVGMWPACNWSHSGSKEMLFNLQLLI